jgi:leader peptidase (prepilin peptidase)/N-methyltransferase
VFGLAFGSFLNVCISRLPRGESVVSPRSRCPRCGQAIRWYDNIPVLSYALLRARCRNCRERISPLYPLVELLTAGLLVAAFARYGLTPEFVKFGAFTMLVLVLIFTDFQARRIPHAVTMLGLTLGFLLSFLVPVDSRPLGWIALRLGIFLDGVPASFLGALAGSAVGALLLYSVGAAFYRLTGKEGLGFGDVTMMAMVGTFLGVPLTLMTILIGSLLGTFVALPAEVLAKRLRHAEWPYGSFLGIAAIYAGLGGDALLDTYLRWSGLGG